MRLPDLDEMRSRGVLSTAPAQAPASRRVLGPGGQADSSPPGGR
ncbi:hypothetical protein ABZX40_38415 [Streptomyces sp. NPDC004610]